RLRIGGPLARFAAMGRSYMILAVRHWWFLSVSRPASGVNLCIIPELFIRVLSMSIEQSLLARAGNKCELCGSEQDVAAVLVSPHSQLTVDTGVVMCGTCQPQVAGADA